MSSLISSTRVSFTLRVSEWLAFETPLKTLEERRASHDPDDPLLHIGMLKAFMDGSLGSRTAALAAPYADDPTNSGIRRYDQTKLNAMSAERAAAGFQLGFHAIGDQANHMALNAFAVAEEPYLKNLHEYIEWFKKCGPGICDPVRWMPPEPRFRIEHAQVLLPSDFDRFAPTLHHRLDAAGPPAHRHELGC